MAGPPFRNPSRSDIGFGLIFNVLGLAPFVGGTVWGGASEARYSRIVGSGLITKIRIHVAVQSGNICLGVYSPSGLGLSAVPGALKISTGAIACPAVGIQDIALPSPIFVASGDFFGMSCDNNIASFLGNSAFGATPLVAGQLFLQGAAHPLPDPANATVTNFRHPMIMGIP